ncbi:Type I restriction-modification system, specificity subunit S [uncultured Candidatus Thioglobus sp.]|nr:Type I restriction-modification system, specificity subunit S [uncultured Candidatus Thioglobus sp.]
MKVGKVVSYTVSAGTVSAVGVSTSVAGAATAGSPVRVSARAEVSGNEFRRELMKHSIGSTVIGIQQKKLNDISISYPPLIKQKKVAKILTAIDQLIKKTETLIDKHTTIKKGVMVDLLTRGIDLATGQLRPSVEQAPHFYKETKQGSVPKEWRLPKLDSVTKAIIDGTHFTPNYTKASIPFLRVTDVQAEKINLEKIKYISAEGHEDLTKRCNPEIEGVLYSKNGAVGIPKIVDWEWGFSIFVSLSLIKPDKNQINNYYLLFLLGSGFIWQPITERSKQGTVTNLHLEEIRGFVVILPCKGEQEEITQRASVMQKHIFGEDQRLRKLINLKNGLMQDLLARRVSV